FFARQPPCAPAGVWAATLERCLALLLERLPSRRADPSARAGASHCAGAWTCPQARHARATVRWGEVLGQAPCWLRLTLGYPAPIPRLQCTSSPPIPLPEYPQQAQALIHVHCVTSHGIGPLYLWIERAPLDKSNHG